MAHRKYKPRNWSFEYDFARDGGADGFLPIGDLIPPGWALLSGSVVILTAVTSGGGAATIRIGTATVPLMTNAITENILTLDGVVRVSIDGAAPAFPRNLVQENLGITLFNGPLLTGRFVVFGQYAIVTTG